MPLRHNPPNPDLGEAPNMLAAYPVAWLPDKYNLTKMAMQYPGYYHQRAGIKAATPLPSGVWW